MTRREKQWGRILSTSLLDVTVPSDEVSSNSDCENRTGTNQIWFESRLWNSTCRFLAWPVAIFEKKKWCCRYVTRRPWRYPRIIWGASLDGASYVLSIPLREIGNRKSWKFKSNKSAPKQRIEVLHLFRWSTHTHTFSHRPFYTQTLLHTNTFTQTLNSTLYTPHLTLYTVHASLHTPHSTLYTSAILLLCLTIFLRFLLLFSNLFSAVPPLSSVFLLRNLP